MVQRFGLTWWGNRWIQSLEQLGAAYDNRLPRGRTYARKGTVHDLAITPGRVTALVDGSRARPYRVELVLATFDDDTWAAILDALAGQLRHAAALLDARMPEDVDDTLADVGVSLFPAVKGSASDLRTSCSCPDWANPCKHVAAVHYVLATRFDDDPFLLMVLRGRGRDEVLAGLRTRRAGGDERVTDATVGAGSPRSVPLADLRPSDLFGGEVPELVIAPQRRDVLALLRRLGSLPGALEEARGEVEHAVERASAAAWELFEGDGDQPRS